MPVRRVLSAIARRALSARTQEAIAGRATLQALHVRARRFVAAPVWRVAARRRLPAAVILAAAGCSTGLVLHVASGRSAPEPVPPPRRLAVDASARGLRPGLPGSEQMVGVGPPMPSPAPLARAQAPATAAAIEAIPAPRNVSPDLLEQGTAKAQVQDRLAAAPGAGGALPGETVDRGQPSVAGPLARGLVDLDPGTTAAIAYIEPYQEPNDWAYRNYCGPGAAMALLSHWDRGYPQQASIDAMAHDMNLNPNMGVWIDNMVQPINERLTEITGRDLGWYRYGEARSLDDLRYMLGVDLIEHAAPLITGLMTGGLPGWDSDVGHFVAIYGYARTAEGVEYVWYADTAAPVSGHSGDIFHVWELGSFWQAVSRNSGQIW